MIPNLQHFCKKSISKIKIRIFLGKKIIMLTFAVLFGDSQNQNIQKEYCKFNIYHE